MQEFNYRQEFPLWQRFYYEDPVSHEIKKFGFPPYDFKIKYYTTSIANAYEVSGKYVNGDFKGINCRKKGDELLVIFDRHDLKPGILKAEMTMKVPSDLYPDGLRTDPIELRTNTKLINGPTPSPTHAEAMAIMPYIKGRDGADGKDGKDGKDGADGKDGKDFTYDDMTEEQKKDLAKKVAENIDTELPWLDENQEDISDDEWNGMLEDMDPSPDEEGDIAKQ